MVPKVAGVLFLSAVACAGAGEAQPPDPLAGLGGGLGSLPRLTRARTRSISAENPTGERGKGGMAVPNPGEPKPVASARAADDLGQGWKVRPFIRVDAHQTATLMDVDGPGVIQHIWLVEGLNRGLVIRFFWDGEETPSVEAPVPDLFAVGHGRFAPVNSLPITVNPANAMNSFWPMPFRKHARITLENQTDNDVPLVAYQITYAETPVPEDYGLFHAQWRRDTTASRNPYVILDGVKGRGRYVGTFLAWTQLMKGWFGEGEIKFYLDGDRDFPTICGTGTEDYFLGSYGFPRSFTTAYSGTVLPASDGAEPPSFWSLYRWHIQDPISFEQELRVTIQALGWGPDGKYLRLADDIASTAYWYQAEPHAPFPPLPALAARLHEIGPPAVTFPGAIEGEALEIVRKSDGLPAAPQDLRAHRGTWSGDAQLFVQATKVGDFVELKIPVAEPGPKRLILHATRAPDYGILRLTVNGRTLDKDWDGYAEKAVPSGPLDLGVCEPREGAILLRVEVVGANPGSTGPKYYLGLDCVVVEKRG